MPSTITPPPPRDLSSPQWTMVRAVNGKLKCKWNDLMHDILSLPPSSPSPPSPPSLPSPLPHLHVELRHATAGIILRDQDQTNIKEGDWIKVNTLGHYKLDEIVCRGIPLVTIIHSTVRYPGFEP